MKYYIHDKTRGYVGNSMVWWRENHRGYTCDIREAHVFDESELPGFLEADDLVAYPVEEVNKEICHHVIFVMQDEAVTGESLKENKKPLDHDSEEA